jgi:hypothetical protein
LSRINRSLVVLAAAAFAFALPLGASSRPAAPTPSPSPTVAPVADPAITKLARQQFLAWQIGTLDKSLYDAQLLPQLTDVKVADTSKHIAPLGALTGLVFIGSFAGEDFPPDAHGYIYQMICSNGKIYQWMVVTGNGKIATMYFRDTMTTEDITAPTNAGSPPPHSPPPPKRLAR